MGGLGISIYRILLIKENRLVKNKIGLKRLMCIILCCEFLVLGFLIGFTRLGPYWEPLRPDCMIVPYQRITDILDVHGQSHGAPSLLIFHQAMLSFTALLMLAMTITEIMIYVVFFHHMYKHDNNQRLRSLLGSDAIKQRNTQNALSFFSQFCSFVVESLLTMTLLAAIWLVEKEKLLFLIFFQFRKFTLTAMAVVDVITSRNLKL